MPFQSESPGQRESISTKNANAKIMCMDANNVVPTF